MAAGPDRTPNTPVRRRRMARGERREAILDVARALVATADDPDTIGVEQIAQRAGVSRALIYEYFGERSKLIEEVRCRFASDFATELNKARAQAGSERELLIGLVATHLGFAAAGAGAYRLATENSEPLVAWVTRHLGDTAAAHLIAAAATESLHAFVATWTTEAEVTDERATELIVTFLDAGLRAVDRLGIRAAVG